MFQIMSKMFFLLFILCFQHIAFATAVNPMLFASLSSTSISHFFLQSNDIGLTWQIIEVPSSHDNTPTQITGLTYQNDNYVVAGKMDDYTSLIGKSLDGINWNFNLTNINHHPYDIKCKENECIDVGTGGYDHYNGNAIIGSIDFGEQWFSNHLTIWDAATLYKLECTSKLCVATGFAKSSPLLLTKNCGIVWTPVNFDSTKSGKWLDLTCQNDSCITVGYIKSTIDSPNIQYSQDGGTTWQSSSLPPFSNLFDAQLTSVHCLDTACVAVGYEYQKGQGITPLLMSTNDQGATWIKNQTPGFTQGKLNQVSCGTQACVAVGTDGVAPIIAFSSDGNTWEKIDLSSTSFPWHGFFSSVNCSGNVCLAGGQDQTETQPPLLAMSTDGGLTWRRGTLPVNLTSSGNALRVWVK